MEIEIRAVFRHILFAACSILLPLIAAAHESLSHNIEAVTAQINAGAAGVEVYLQRGELYRLDGNRTAAEADFRHAERIDADAAALDFRLGRLYSDIGDDERAQSALERFLAHRPDHRLAWITLARTLVRTGEPARAAAAYDRGLTPDAAPELVLERARALVLAGQADTALTGIDAALDQRPGVIVFELEAIDLELNAGRFDAALERLQHIVDRMPRKESWLARRGEILERADRRDAAKAAYARALAAIEALAPHRRATRQSAELETRILAAFERVSPGPGGAASP